MADARKSSCWKRGTKQSEPLVPLAASIEGLIEFAWPSHARAIADATVRRVSAVNFVESAVVIDASRDPVATRRFDDFIREADISIAPITETQAPGWPPTVCNNIDRL